MSCGPYKRSGGKASGLSRGQGSPAQCLCGCPKKWLDIHSNFLDSWLFISVMNQDPGFTTFPASPSVRMTPSVRTCSDVRRTPYAIPDPCQTLSNHIVIQTIKLNLKTLKPILIIISPLPSSSCHPYLQAEVHVKAHPYGVAVRAQHRLFLRAVSRVSNCGCAHSR